MAEKKPVVNFEYNIPTWIRLKEYKTGAGISGKQVESTFGGFNYMYTVDQFVGKEKGLGTWEERVWFATEKCELVLNKFELTIGLKILVTRKQQKQGDGKKPFDYFTMKIGENEFSTMDVFPEKEQDELDEPSEDMPPDEPIQEDYTPERTLKPQPKRNFEDIATPILDFVYNYGRAGNPEEFTPDKETQYRLEVVKASTTCINTQVIEENKKH